MQLATGSTLNMGKVPSPCVFLQLSKPYKMNYFLLAAIIFSLPVERVSAQHKERNPWHKPNSSNLVIMPFNDALERKFHPLHEFSPKGPQLHILEGDPEKGPSLTLFRYSQNYSGSGRLHNHTYGYHLWLIEGTMKHWDETGSEENAPILVPGSYIYQPKDELHAANCLSRRCTAYVMFDGPIETGFPDDSGPGTDGN